MARVVGRSEATKRSTRGTRMLDAAVKQLQREAQQAYKTPPSKGGPPKTPPAPERKKPRKCLFQIV